ncbi:T9SS type B sorting domain-containing protein [Chryseobacterium sp.]|uniref:T9SS type B sorting domain-containing protein n=1 Tax=Chryseobacterium sp. TaxID=1871047 RepID=UPI0024E25B70|nr:T9SS type B sorting domain-containing protein [Chryseobacterium sp.]
MKRILFIFILLLSLSVQAQRDTDHWFAPMAGSLANGSPKQALYLSTDSTTPFPVTIYNNNAVIGTVTISKGNPQTFDVPINLMLGQNPADAMSVKTRGLHLHGDFPFFATYRFSEVNHGEILTSKGKAGIGTTFYAVYAPLMNNSNTLNFTCGILATEDNTQIKVSGYNMTTWFYNNFNGLTHPSITITLNKGQSYIFAGLATKPGNKDGFIGAKIEATKPVSVTNGNFRGQFGLTPPYNGEDIIMDQSVPVERLGDEFVLIKGMGNLLPEIEGAIIVATENDTKIWLNNNPTPVATLNEGDYYRVKANNYIVNGPNHLNMYIKTSKNVYTYQLLSGTADNDATEGFNYIPPLNCFLPKTIDEIGKIGELPYANTFNPPLFVKLNILTQTGGNVTVNGVAPTAAQGPFPVTGTTDWVSYSIPNITGNITVTSTNAVTAGIAGGSGNLGYGGYFAGFNSIPVISKSLGECAPGIVLQVESGFTHYQWNLNGNPIPGATTNTFSPTQGGSYTVSITKENCVYTTYPYKVYSCLVNTIKPLNACIAGRPTLITPAFSNSTQIPVPGTVQIIVPPANGTLTIDPVTGILTYTANAGTTVDTFTYKFCGNDPLFTDCEQVKINVTVQPLVLTDATVSTCNINDSGIFDLTTANVGGPATAVRKYYPTLADLNAGINEIIPANAYPSTVPATVYVKVTTAEGCTANAKITLQYYRAPDVMDATLSGCFVVNNPSQGTFNLTAAVVTSTNPVTKNYYPTLNDAVNGTNEIMTPTVYVSSNTTVYVKITTVNGCSDFAKITLKVTPPKPSSILVDQYICPLAVTKLDAGSGYTSYLWSTGATTQVIQNVPVGNYWVILTADGCETKQFVKVIAVPGPRVKRIDIKNNTVTIIVEGGEPPYQYSRDGIVWQDSNVFTDLPRGRNIFYIKDSYNCAPIQVQITVPNLVNAITPNSDGINDDLDYSELAYLKDLKFNIFSRYGQLLFSSDKSNSLKWNGTIGGTPVSSGTYWYEITWTESDSKTPVAYSGWILVKNRN